MSQPKDLFHELQRVYRNQPILEAARVGFGSTPDGITRRNKAFDAYDHLIKRNHRFIEYDYIRYFVTGRKLLVKDLSNACCPYCWSRNRTYIWWDVDQTIVLEYRHIPGKPPFIQLRYRHRDYTEKMFAKPLFRYYLPDNVIVRTKIGENAKTCLKLLNQFHAVNAVNIVQEFALRIAAAWSHRRSGPKIFEELEARGFAGVLYEPGTKAMQAAGEHFRNLASNETNP